MSNIKYIFLTVVFACVMASAAVVNAQDEVLVAGKASLKRSDIGKLIEFYEWALDAKFSESERERFTEYTTNEFKSNPTKGRQTIDDIVNGFPKIQAAAPDARERMRKDFAEAFVAEARKGTDDNSRMMVSIYETAHSNAQMPAAAPAETQQDRSEAKAASPGKVAALAGKWVWASSGSSTSTTSGVYLGSNGSRHTYEFGPDGQVEYTGIMNVMTGACRMQIFKSSKGRATLNGSTLTISWSPATFVRDDSCTAAQNYKKTLPAETETYEVGFKTDYGQRQLCMTQKNETCYSPAQ